MAISMRSVVRAAYSGRLRGSSDVGWRCNSAIGSNRWRLASARNTSNTRINNTASKSHRLNRRVQPPTEMGTFTRMVSDRLSWTCCHRFVVKFAISEVIGAASWPGSHNIRGAVVNLFADRESEFYAEPRPHEGKAPMGKGRQS